MARGDLRILVVAASLLLAVLVNWRRVEALPVGEGGRFVHGIQEDLPTIERREDEIYGGNPDMRQSFGDKGLDRDEGGSMRSVYLDSSHFLPYIHPKLIYEEDLPQFLPPNTKRATKGMMVDVVDFVAKGGSTGQRLGQDMRSSGRKRRSIIY